MQSRSDTSYGEKLLFVYMILFIFSVEINEFTEVFGDVWHFSYQHLWNGSRVLRTTYYSFLYYSPTICRIVVLIEQNFAKCSGMLSWQLLSAFKVIGVLKKTVDNIFSSFSTISTALTLLLS